MSPGKFETITDRGLPDMLVMEVLGLPVEKSQAVAEYAVSLAKRNAPKLSGASSSRISPVVGEGFFGLHWLDDYLWYQETGIQPFTMHRLAGKVIPMWINDPSGKERQKNPRAKVRIVSDGRTQVLIFRRAANPGERKIVRRRMAGVWQDVSVPRSWPGAPGRINRRELAAPNTAPGRIGGRIARGNVGVRWRHPGLDPRGFLYQSIRHAAIVHKLDVNEVVPIRSSLALAA
jgi:hypothetical protein